MGGGVPVLGTRDSTAYYNHGSPQCAKLVSNKVIWNA